MPGAGVSLLHGAFPFLLAASAAATLLASAARGGWRWWLGRVVPVVGAAFGVVVLVNARINRRGQLGDMLPATLLLAVSLPLAATGLSVAGWRRSRWVGRGVSLLAVPLSALFAANLINQRYAYEPTLGAVFGMDVEHWMDPAHLRLGSATEAQRSGAWHQELAVPGQPAGEIAHGYVSKLHIPATISRFPARDAYTWVPPAFLLASRPHLPVIVMLGGTPGRPIDMIRSGGAIGVADRIAASHHGYAPILVFPDPNGSFGADTECVDGRRGNAETYLTRDVPSFIMDHFSPAGGPRHWAIIGFSEGGTCAMELALRHPDLFGTFVDIAGDSFPNLGTGRSIAAATVAKLYDGDRAAFLAHDPRRLARNPADRHLVAWFDVGGHDFRRHSLIPDLVAAMRVAGLTTRCTTTPGGHDWIAARDAVAHSLPSLAATLAAGTPGTAP